MLDSSRAIIDTPENVMGSEGCWMGDENFVELGTFFAFFKSSLEFSSL